MDDVKVAYTVYQARIKLWDFSPEPPTTHTELAPCQNTHSSRLIFIEKDVYTTSIHAEPPAVSPYQSQYSLLYPSDNIDA